MRDSGSLAEFTVQEVVDRSGLSIRMFYQFFDGKQQLLLTLFEESVASTVAQLRQQTDANDDPLQQLRDLVVAYYELCRPSHADELTTHQAPPRALMEFAQDLLTSQQEQAGRIFAPLVAVFEEALAAARVEGSIRAGLPLRHVAATVLEMVMFSTFSTILAGEQPLSGVEQAELLWNLFANGICGP